METSYASLHTVLLDLHVTDSSVHYWWWRYLSTRRC